MLRHRFSSLSVMIFISSLSMSPLIGAHFTPVRASVSTDEVAGLGDAADDPAIWIHPDDPAKSLVIGTDKTSGLVVFDLDGKTRQTLTIGRLNNVDLRDGFALGDRLVSLVAAGNRSTNTIAFFEVDKELRILKPLPQSLPAGLQIYGSCFYRSPNGEFYIFVNSKNGDVIQWKLIGDSSGEISAQKVRQFNVGSQVEACVADDERRTFYISEEKVGIWKYQAEATGGETRVLVDRTGANGHLVADVEGLAIFQKPHGGGYLVASSQGDNSYALYERSGENKFITKFSITYGDGSDIVRDTDGLEVTNIGLSPAFPEGMLVVQDGWNAGKRQNFKFVSWAEIGRLDH